MVSSATENQSSHGQSDSKHLRQRELENRGSAPSFHAFPSCFQAGFTALDLILTWFLSSRLLKHLFPPSLKPHDNELFNKPLRCAWEEMGCSFLLPRSYLAFAPRERERLSGGGSVQPGTISHAVRAPAGPHMCSSRQPNQRSCDHFSEITVNQRQMHGPPPGPAACKAAHTCLIIHDGEASFLLGT